MGQIDYVLWGRTELIVVTGNGRRIQSFDYSNGFANWEYTLFSKNELLDKKFVGFESKREAGNFYVTDSKQICYISLKDKLCIDLQAELVVIKKFFITIKNNRTDSIYLLFRS